MTNAYWAVNNAGGQTTGANIQSGNSPMPLLRSNQARIAKSRALGYSVNSMGWNQASSCSPDPSSIQFCLGRQESTFDSLYNAAYSRFIKSVKDGKGASLGITLATLGQTREMITKRSHQLADHFTQYADNPTYYGRGSNRRTVASRKKFIRESFQKNVWRDRSKAAADTHLEYIFGWVPLIQDIRDGLEVLTKSQPYTFYKATSRGNFADTYVYQTQYSKDTFDRFGSCRVTLGGRATVSNPNLFLANQLGLINLPGVAWDLIPWSFVVGMFVNVNQVLSSYTDLVGVNLDDYSRTQTLKGRCDAQHDNYHLSQPRISRASSWGYLKTRDVGGVPERPSFEMRAPPMNLSTAAMAFSLAVQQFTRFSKLLS